MLSVCPSIAFDVPFASLSSISLFVHRFAFAKLLLRNYKSLPRLTCVIADEWKSVAAISSLFAFPPRHRRKLKLCAQIQQTGGNVCWGSVRTPPPLFSSFFYFSRRIFIQFEKMEMHERETPKSYERFKLNV